MPSGLLYFTEIKTVRAIKRPRARFYGKAVQEALKIARCASNCLASKRLSPFLAELVPVLERHSHLELKDEVRHQLISRSPATIDRILKPWRSLSGRATTKRGSFLKHKVPVRTFADWEEKRPGFFEADLVAHYGWSIEGAYLYTLTLTDIATTWTECLPLLYRGQDAVIHAIDLVCPLIPFPILGLDSDNVLNLESSFLFGYTDPCSSNSLNQTKTQVASTIVRRLFLP